MLAVTMVRDEADIIERTVANLLEQNVDLIVVADNLSVDGTGDLVRSWERVVVVRDDEPGYWQASKMTALAGRYATEGEWVIPFDADEIWRNLDLLTDDFDVALARPHVHIGDRHIGTEPFPKVAFRWRPGTRIEMGNHFVTGAGPRVLEGLAVCHHQYRTLAQVRRKVRNGTRAYQATDLPGCFGAHWRTLAALSDDELGQWWAGYIRQETQPCRL